MKDYQNLLGKIFIAVAIIIAAFIIANAIDNAGATAPYGNITNGDILDALLELRDTLLTNIAKRQ